MRNYAKKIQKHDMHATNGPVKLSIIIASLLASSCGQLSLDRNVFSGVFSDQSIAPRNTLNGNNAYDNMDDQKFFLTEAIKTAMAQQEYVQALTYCDQLTKQYPDYETGYVNYSSIGRKINAHQQVLVKLYDYKSRYPNNVNIINEIAKVYYDLGKYTQALKEIDMALDYQTDNWRTYSLRGVISDKLNYVTEARASYEKALELSPENPVVLNNLAASMIKEGKLNEAEFYAVKAMEAPAANIKIYRTYAKILTLKGQHEKARKILSEKIKNADKVDNIIQSASQHISRPILWGRQ